MKTSNKLLLGFVGFALLFSLAMYYVLYSEYRKGHWVSVKEMHQEMFVKQEAHPPRVIVLDGTAWVNLIPADQFSLELPRKNKDPDWGLFESRPVVKLKGDNHANPAISWHEHGDTLFVTGHFDAPLHRPWSNWFYRRDLPQVNVLGPAVDEILLNNGQIYLQGTAAPADKRSARMTVRNSTLWLGMQYDSRSPAPREFFDSLEIRSANSFVMINKFTTIDRLGLTLTDSSEANDQFATIHSSAVRSDGGSRIEFTGQNLKNAQLNLH